MGYESSILKYMDNVEFQLIPTQSLKKCKTSTLSIFSGYLDKFRADQIQACGFDFSEAGSFLTNIVSKAPSMITSLLSMVKKTDIIKIPGSTIKECLKQSTCEKCVNDVCSKCNEDIDM